jgi:two-component system OmpR family sensor kinase
VDERFESAIWDLEYTQIFSTLHHQRVHLDEEIYRTGDRIHLIKILDTYYLGAKYLGIEVPEESEWQIQVWRTLAVYGGVGFVILMGFGWLLARLFVRPMRRSILLLDRFIRDTTHELNTPLSTMLANIETMEPEHLSPANARRLRRIDAAARTVSTLYEDLKFVTLESGKTPEDVPIDMAVLVEGRLEYFSVLIESKQLQLQTDLVPASVVADRRLIERVVDNLLSNAIKYNRRGGAIRVRVRPDELVVADTGVGIAPEDMPRIFDRYARFNESEGGFGIGLSIVRRIVDHYGMSIHVASEPGRGTTMTLRWRPTE